MNSLAWIPILFLPVMAILLTVVAVLFRRQRATVGNQRTRPDDPDLRGEVHRLVEAGKRKEASKLVRQRTGMGTIDADRLIDEIGATGT